MTVSTFALVECANNMSVIRETDHFLVPPRGTPSLDGHQDGEQFLYINVIRHEQRRGRETMVVAVNGIMKKRHP